MPREQRRHSEGRRYLKLARAHTGGWLSMATMETARDGHEMHRTGPSGISSVVPGPAIVTAPAILAISLVGIKRTCLLGW
jgi:hypothetical protein